MKMIARNEGFVCENCHYRVEPIKFGGSYRNHCPFCLYSKHVDTDTPRDRKNNCLGLMIPSAVFTRRTGEYVLVHRCQKCHFERYTRIAGDDDFELVTKLSSMTILKFDDRR